MSAVHGPRSTTLTTSDLGLPHRNLEIGLPSTLPTGRMIFLLEKRAPCFIFISGLIIRLGGLGSMQWTYRLQYSAPIRVSSLPFGMCRAVLACPCVEAIPTPFARLDCHLMHPPMGCAVGRTKRLMDVLCRVYRLSPDGGVACRGRGGDASSSCHLRELKETCLGIKQL